MIISFDFSFLFGLHTYLFLSSLSFSLFFLFFLSLFSVFFLGRIDFSFCKFSKGGGSGGHEDDEAELEALARKREREKAAAVGKNYAEKPRSYKKGE